MSDVVGAEDRRVQLPDKAFSEFEKLFECPVCYDIILPPTMSCSEGHSCCERCYKAITKCPVCRCPISSLKRNLIADQMLELCRVKCKYTSGGCNVILNGLEIASHLGSCQYRPIHCRECDIDVSYEDYLNHLLREDKLDKQKASECSSGFEILHEDFNNAGRVSIWEPTWMSCYDQDFFCSLEYNGEDWWLWVASLTLEGQTFKGQITLWSKEAGKELSFTGPVHSLRLSPAEVLMTGDCLIVKGTTLKGFIYEGGIDVLVRIDKGYSVPRTRKGIEVESPLAINTRPAAPATTTPVVTFTSPQVPVTPTRTIRRRNAALDIRSAAVRTLLEEGGETGASRRVISGRIFTRHTRRRPPPPTVIH